MMLVVKSTSMSDWAVVLVCSVIICTNWYSSVMACNSLAVLETAWAKQVVVQVSCQNYVLPLQCYTFSACCQSSNSRYRNLYTGAFRVTNVAKEKGGLKVHLNLQHAGSMCSTVTCISEQTLHWYTLMGLPHMQATYMETSWTRSCLDILSN